LLTVDEEASNYPSVFPQLEFSELREMNETYQSENSEHICSTLNMYGFTGYSEIFFENGINPCEDRVVVRVEMTNSDTLQEAVKKKLLQNEKYTGVSDTSRLKLKGMESIQGCIVCSGPDQYSGIIEWKLVFENQYIDSVKVIDTEITVIMDAEGVNQIWGNWYPDFKVPDFVNFGYEEVQEGMVGWQIDMRPYTGEEEIYTVQAEDLSTQPYKVYLPIEDEGEMELEIRTCWAIPISQERTDFDGWIAYIDIEEGFLVDIEAQ